MRLKSHADIEEQREEALHLLREAANERAEHEQLFKHHPLYVELQAERAAHAVTAAKLDASLNPKK